MKSTIHLLAVLLFLFGGCTAAEEPPETFPHPAPSAETIISAPDVLPETERPELSEGISEDVPLILYFREISEYTAFVNSLELSEEEFDRFVRENNYRMNDIRTQDDAAALITTLDSMTVPVIENAEAVGITVAVETGYCTIQQKNDADEIYHVRIPLDEVPLSIDPVNKTKLSANTSDELYYFENYPKQNHHQYEGFLNGSYIFIWTNTADKTAADAVISSITFTTLADLIE